MKNWKKIIRCRSLPNCGNIFVISSEKLREATENNYYTKRGML